MMNFSKTALLLLPLIIFFLVAGFFAYQWWQVKGDLERKLAENRNLLEEISRLKLEIEKLQKEVSITTDKTEYKQGEKVKIIIKNNTERTFVTTIERGRLRIHRYENDKWIREEGVPFRGVPCGAVAEIPTPIFITPGEIIERVWDQNIIWCEDGLEKRKKALGKYRFELEYAEVTDSFIKYGFGGISPKEWKFTYSREFVIVK